MVITTPDIAPGFQLAGVETFAVDDAAAAADTLRTLLDDAEASLIVVREDLLEAMPPRLRRRAARSVEPLVMGIPGGLPDITGEERRERLTELIRQAIGFQITLDADDEDHHSPNGNKL